MKPRNFLIFIVFLAVCATVRSEEARRSQIRGMVVYPNQFNPTTKVQLNGGQLTAFTRADGSFSFYDIPPGTYTLEILSPTHAFSQIKFDIRDDSTLKDAVEYKYPGAPALQATHPFVLNAHTAWNFFEVKESFGIGHILKNPMVLMMGFTLLMVFVMPKMMENMDPEERKQMEEQMQSSGDPGKLFKQLMGQEGKDDDDDDD